jgi:site-specific DNA-methyltransferase (adenine-specific)
VLPKLQANSFDAVVTDPPYGLEFMGKDWDRLEGDDWRTGGGFSKPGIGERATPWAAHGNGDTANATCANCGGRMRGVRRCECVEPDWRVKGKPLTAAGVNSRRAQGRKMQAWHETWAREALRVLKPGGHLLAFGGTRTYHRLACALEEAGFEIRDCIAWIYGSGFPKSLDVSKAIDRVAGAEREVVALEDRGSAFDGGTRESVGHSSEYGSITNKGGVARTAPATTEAERWDGWGTALKPAHESIVVARKPLIGTVAANVLEHGTGAIHVDGCRIELLDPSGYERNHSGARGHDGTRDPQRRGVTDLRPGGGRPKRTARGQDTNGKNTYGANGPGGGSFADGMTMVGRWPANVVMDATAAAELDARTGQRTSGNGNVCRKSGADRNGNTSAAYGAESRPTGTAMIAYGDTGGASRFFYCAKASPSERNAGVHSLKAKPLQGSNPRDNATRNHHPTVKPIALIRWLVRLVTPPDGVVLDMFAGSGTTGCAAVLEGFRFVGIEREAEYVAIARARIKHWAATVT